jgi:hypothetical protein
MSYQAMAMDDNGFEIAQTQISIQVSILEETPSGLVSFVEEHTVTTDAFGMFSINIGEGNSDDDYASVDWSKSNFLKVELDEDMDGIYTLMGVSPFNSVPYSYMAENVMNPEDLMDNLGDHTATQVLDMDSNYVSQVLAPELPLDAANKQYVDDMIGDITTGAGEIVDYYLPAENFNIIQMNNNNYVILYVVPQNKVVIMKQRVRLIYVQDNGFISLSDVAPTICHENFPFQYSGIESNGNEKIVIGFPGDTISAFLNNNYSTPIAYKGFYHQYSVSATQIDDNNTSYSMVSLDEGASSSGGAITEGTGGSSSQVSYLMSQVSQDEMNLADAMSYCRNLEEGGYTDWYLPSLDKILELYSGKSDSIPNDESSVWTTSYNIEWGSNGYVYYTISLGSLSRSGYNHSANRKVVCIRD